MSGVVSVYLRLFGRPQQKQIQTNRRTHRKRNELPIRCRGEVNSIDAEIGLNVTPKSYEGSIKHTTSVRKTWQDVNADGRYQYPQSCCD